MSPVGSSAPSVATQRTPRSAGASGMGADQHLDVRGGEATLAFRPVLPGVADRPTPAPRLRGGVACSGPVRPRFLFLDAGAVAVPCRSLAVASLV